MSLNQELSRVFAEMAAILEIKGANPFKAIAFSKVSRILKDMTMDIRRCCEEGTLGKLEGIGASSRKIIEEYVKTGRSTEHDELAASVPAGLLPLLEIQGMGPKTIALLWKERGVTSLDELKAAIETGALKGLKGLGEKKIQAIREGIEFRATASQRLGIGHALPVAAMLLERLRGVAGVKRAEIAGSLRRRRETIGDVDLVCALKEEGAGASVAGEFVKFPEVARILGQGSKKASIVTVSGLQVDLRMVPEESFGAALMYFTGSKEHNVKVRGLAQSLGMTLNEWGLFEVGEEAPKRRSDGATKGEERVDPLSERGVLEKLYARLRLPASSESIPGSLPVLFFGDPARAAVATVGLNPSPFEFLDDKGKELEGYARRFETLNSLSVASREKITEAQCARAIDRMRGYFREGKPVYKWFDHLIRVLRGMHLDYASGRAVHLDLVQEATAPWSELRKRAPGELHRLQIQDRPFLQWQLESFPLMLILCNGKTVMDEVVQLLDVETVDTAELKRLRWAIGRGNAAGREVIVAGWNRPLTRPTGLDHQGEEEFGALLAEAIGRVTPDVLVRASGGTTADAGVRRTRRQGEPSPQPSPRVLGEGEGARGERVAGGAEEAIYRKLGMEYVEPELREDRGEVEAARERRLPVLIERGDIRGDLHTHTTASDGVNSIEEMAEAAKRLGYEYLAITDHSKSQVIANGLTADRLMKHVAAIRKALERIRGITLLAGCEVDILADGHLDFEDSVLSELDFVVASPHVALKQPEAKATARILRAIENRYVNVIGHPTGRIINARAGLPLDFGRIFKAAAETGTALEINAGYPRLDLDEVNSRGAMEAGAMLSINTDAHAVEEFDNMPFGLGVARRAWATKGQVINCLGLAALRKFIGRKR